MQTENAIHQLALDRIESRSTIRKHGEESILNLMHSMADIGQMSPIGVTESEKEGFFDLLFGAGRLLSAKRLRWSCIEAKVFPRESTPGEALRRSVSENTVRFQMTFMEQWEVINQYAQETKQNLQSAGMELGFQQSTISKIQKCIERVTDANKKKFAAGNVGFTIVYELSQAAEPLQSELVDGVVNKGWTRKQVTDALKPVKQGLRRFEFAHGQNQLSVNIPRGASVETIHEVLKAFSCELKKAIALNDDPATVAQVLKGHRHVG